MRETTATAPAQLPQIPLVDLGRRGLEDLAEIERARCLALLQAGRAHLGAVPLAVFDRLSRAWARRRSNPDAEVIDAIAQGCPTGIWFMNFCYEWGCTTGVSPDPDGAGARLRRTLDWPFPAIGTTLVIARREGAAGPYHAITWPGFLGVITGMAEGRFAIAINQAPLPLGRTGSPLLAWAGQRLQVWRSSAAPPAQLLRQVFETAKDFASARALLRDTPIALPAIFSLAGTRPEECCMIERTETAARVFDGPQAATNHWVGPDGPARDRGNHSIDRRARMLDRLAESDTGFDWVAPPILNKDTRLAVIAAPAEGRLDVLGFEREMTATAPFRMAGRMLVAKS